MKERVREVNEKWNFRGYVAVPLESYGKHIIGETFYSADQIETGDFIDAMLSILSVLDLDIHNFSIRCEPFAGKTAREIGEETVKDLFSEFLNLYRSKTEG